VRTTDLAPGDVFAGYRIQSPLGEGGMGMVFVAEHLGLHRKVALKLLPEQLAVDPRFRERFVRESQLAASLDHPNVVPVYEAGEAEGRLFIAMRYVEGIDLRALLNQHGKLDPARTIRILAQVASALDAAHELGLVHRDVKPGNILLARRAGSGSSRDAAEHVYLSDFGLTKRASSDSGITATGQFVGTLDYAAPEQFEGKPLDGRTDVYSLACVLFECLTGEVPYKRDQDAALMYAHLMAPVPSATERNGELPTAIDEVIARGMAKSPNERFATAGEVIRSARPALGVASGELPLLTAAQVGGLQATVPPPGESHRVRRRLIGVAALVAVALVGGIVFAVTRGGGGSKAARSTSSAGAGVAGAASVVALDQKTGKPAGSVALGKGTGTLSVGFGSVWVANQNEDTVSRIDPKTRKVVATIHVGRRPTGVAVGEGDPNVWVITSDGVWAIDPLTNGVVATIKLTNLPLALTVGEGSVWVTYQISDQSPEGLFRIDPNSRTVVERIHIAEATFSPSPVAVAIAPDAVWVVTPGLQVGVSGGFLNRWDLAARRRTQQGIGIPVDVGVGSDSVWILQANGVVLRVDLATSKVDSRIGTASGATAIAVGEDAVWVVNRLKGTLTRIDPATNTAGPPVDLGGKPSSVATGEGAVWVRLDGS
jgi:serine/threonine-protein kinase